MSAGGGNGKYFNATIVSNVPTPSSNILIAGWYKRASGAGFGSDNYLWDLTASDQASVFRTTEYNNGGNPAKRGNGTWEGGSPVNANISGGDITENTWRLCGLFVPPTGNLKVYDEANTATVALGTNSEADNLSRLILGNGASINAYTYYNGRFAEMSCFLVSGSAQADSIMSSLATTKADAVGVGTLVYYYPLESDATTGVTGPALTNNGSITFDSGDHPSLSGGATGVARIMGGKIIGGNLVNGGLAA